MRADFCMNGALPQLAWMAEIDRESLAVSAVFGRSVEYGDDFLVAGVWNGPFSKGDFGSTDCLFGTGLLIRDGAVILVPSAAITDAIYYAERGGRVVAANSLPMLLAATNDRLDPHFAFYDRITESIHRGIDDYEKVIPTQSGSVLRVFFRNLKVTAAGLEEFDKRWPPAFPDYHSYLIYVTENYASIYRNIRDSARRHRLDIVSTQSRGYDTTAVNTIAAKHQVDSVFTIAEAKEAAAFVGTSAPSRDSDDGSDICEILGLTATQIERRLYERSFDEEYLFYATIHHADAASLLGLKAKLARPSIMLTGVMGDIVWATDKYFSAHEELLLPSTEPNPQAVSADRLREDFRGPDTWLHGLSEIGLDWGLIQFGPAFIGARRQPEIFRITMGEEMAPWRLGNDYDRPIPRRIAEEDGRIPRHYFGQKKMATVTEFPLPPVPVGAALRDEYFRFLQNHLIVSPLWRRIYRWVHWINARIIYHTPYRYRYLYYANRFLSKLGRGEMRIPMLYSRLNGRLYCLCVNKRVGEYKKALQGDRRAGSIARPATIAVGAAVPQSSGT